ncbi:penicillin-binding protein activator [Shumkonia mesophila]|uniref:penicillin-binding protein activator n=1 Tax=Shumkonia mesophila TaxID=2838854 RepID=UPI0029350674|nr:penicillin-binding protein activator [Shumkonia mesophila]
MTRLPHVLKRFAAAPCLLALVMVLGACESSRLPPWMQGEIGPPTQAAPQPSAPGARPPVPSLAPLLSPPGIETPGGGAGAEAGAMPGIPSAQAPRVALLLPLSGPQSGLGKSLLNAAQMAIFDFADENFELLVHDTRGTPEGAAQAAETAIGEGAALILGPLLSSSVKAVTPIARTARVPVVAFSSDRLVAGDGIFTMGFYPETEVRRVVEYARTKGLLRFAALVPDNEYGAAVVGALQRTADAGGGLVVRVQYYNPHAQDFAAVVRQLASFESRRQALAQQRAELEKRNDEVAQRALQRLNSLQTIGDLPFDALLVADGGKRLQAIAAHLPFYDIDPARVRMLGTGQWDEPGVGAEPALVGGWFASPTPQARAEFEKQYDDVYGRKPPRLATLAYDATALAAILARSEGGARFDIEALTQPSGFFGRDGIFRLRRDGQAERGLAILQVGRQGFSVVDKAPESFATPMF